MNIPKPNYKIYYGDDFCHNKSFVYSNKLYKFLIEMFDDKKVALDVKYWCEDASKKQIYENTDYEFRVEKL